MLSLVNPALLTRCASVTYSAEVWEVGRGVEFLYDF